METIKISVRSLVEFLLRSGDLDNRRGAPADKEAMQLGSKLHRKIQGRMGSSYQAEVPLKYTEDCGEYSLSIEGRADGIQSEEGETLVDEIKGIYRDVNLLEEPVPVHLAQAKCYAYMYAAKEGKPSMGVQMTYCNLETEEIRRFRQTFSMEELKTWFLELVESYKKWCLFQVRWKRERQESIRETVFPFPYREGQKELAAGVYRTIYHKKKLFIQAPTGVGKTISTVFPALKAVGEGLGDKVFYLTAKTITRTAAQEAFSLLKSRGLRYKVITLTAKERICPWEETVCNPDACPYAKGHFDRVNDAVYEMITRSLSFTREDLLRQSEKWQVCPFELSLDTAVWVDAVICDYNYVFDPRAQLKRFFGEGAKGDYVFLVDEAHNLVERGREMYSAELVKEDFLEVKRAVKGHSKKLERLLEKCNKTMLAWKRECEDYVLLSGVGNFVLSLMNLSGAMEEYLEEAPQGEAGEKVLDLYFQVRAFLDTHDRLDDHYVIYTRMQPEGSFGVKLFCVDPSARLQECMDRGRSTILFSATFLPISYYTSLLSGEEDDYRMYARSPFDPDRKLLLIGGDVSSRYTRRGEREYRKIAEYIQKTVECRKGNYMVFFPSYRMMEDVGAYVQEALGERARLLRQMPGMTEQEKEAFLEEFSGDRTESLVGLCVMGGIFGEGIDLKHNRLIGAVLVGTGLPQICSEREILKNYYQEKGQDGFAYAYQYPGMNKVLQSAGRVIRTVEDQGVILLLDERFLQEQYRSLFPREWQGYETCTLRNAGEKLEAFWKRQEAAKQEFLAARSGHGSEP